MSKVLGQESLLAIKSWTEGKFATKATTLAGYGITDAYTKSDTDTAIATAISTAISGVYTYKGSVHAYANLPVSGQQVGDVYNVETADPSHGIKAGDNVAWDGTSWDVLAGLVDLSNYVTVTGLNTILADYLTSSVAAATYVAKEAGKGLSSNDYTTTEKNKLAGIAAGAEANVLEGITVNGTAATITNKIAAITVPTKTSDLTNDSNFAVDANYVHTDNNYTSTEKTKLSGIASGAQVNVLEGVQVNGTDLSIASKKVNIVNMTGATDSAAGLAGLVPAPAAGDDTKFLSGDGTWKTVSVYNLPIASASTLGGIKVGTNLSIDSTTGVLSATDTTYSAGDGLTLTGTTFAADEYTTSETLAILNGNS